MVGNISFSVLKVAASSAREQVSPASCSSQLIIPWLRLEIPKPKPDEFPRLGKIRSITGKGTSL